MTNLPNTRKYSKGYIDYLVGIANNHFEELQDEDDEVETIRDTDKPVKKVSAVVNISDQEKRLSEFRAKHRLFFGGIQPRPKGFETDHEAILYMQIKNGEGLF